MKVRAVIHSGAMLDCKVCSPETAEKKRDKRERFARIHGKLTLDIYIRRQVSEELGEDEPGKDARFQLLQKYGIAAPRIDRSVTKPNWMGVAEWKRKQNDWYKQTKGMVAPQQSRRATPSQQESFNQRIAASPYKSRFGLHPKDTRTLPPNFGPV